VLNSEEREQERTETRYGYKRQRNSGPSIKKH
jgi:hypothetical protein